MIVVTVFEPNGNSIWLKNCHHDHIPFTVKGIGNIVFSVYTIITHNAVFSDGPYNNYTMQFMVMV